VAEDKNLTCRDCGKTFVFTAGEQAFFAEKSLSDPIRCPDCRRLRKQQRSMDAGPGAAPSSAPRGGDFRPSGGFDRTTTTPRPGDHAPRTSRESSSEEDDRTRGFRKARPAATRFNPPKKEQAAPVAKEKRPNNRRNEEKLMLNWKEEVGIDDLDAESDWLPVAESEDEE
jgi:DNA-directed RNA polymerase subunit RPC12/RpoP